MNYYDDKIFEYIRHIIQYSFCFNKCILYRSYLETVLYAPIKMYNPLYNTNNMYKTCDDLLYFVCH